MRTEISKSFEKGFLLSEQELRRIHDTIVQHVARKLQPEETKRTYEIRYANGGISHPSSLDEVLKEENIGSKAITRLHIAIHDEKPEHEIDAHVTFCDPGQDKAQPPIHYGVTGNERDWVFVATSDLNERIGRIVTLGPAKSWRKPVVFLSGLAILATFGFILFAMRQIVQDQATALDQLHQAWNKGEIKDPVDVMFRLEKIRSKFLFGEGPGLFALMALPLALMTVQLFGPALVKAYYLLFPPFTFYWGEAIGGYDKRQRMARIVLGTIIGGVILSVIANIVTNVLVGK